MLAVSPLRPTTKNGRGQGEMEITSSSTIAGDHFDFPEFAGPGTGCLLDSIDFDDLFVGIHDGDVLPDLEMDPELLAEFSVCPSSTGDLEEDTAVSVEMANQVVPNCSSSNGNINPSSCNSDGESKKVEDEGDGCRVSAMETEKKKSKSLTSPAKDREKSKKLTSSQAKKKKNNNNNNNQGKRKTKVDWTPDLHRRFVQAVEQLGVDKAVPSRILELMGIDCLTRHNIASHLQKYRSHRKHLLAREAEAASWSQKRQMYGIAVAPPGGGGSGKGKVSHSWHAPTIGFPPPMTAPPIHHHPFRPLHVWGHPTHHVEHQPMIPIWPKQLVPSPSPLLHPPPQPPTWPPTPAAHHPRLPVDPTFWHSHRQHVPNAVTPAASCFPQPLPATRFAAPPVPGIPTPHAAMYKHEHGVAAPPTALSGPNHPPLDFHPTKESIDAAIGDALSKPYLPLPIGLKPPSMDSVMGELQRQGIPKIPPSCS